MTRLYLIRHGESAHNALNRIQGHFDAPLSERGIQQVARLARRLALNPPDLIFSSDLVRAYESARAIATACALPLARDARLREFDLGTWTNLTWEELRLGYPDEWDRYTKGDPEFRRGGGESTRDVKRRMVSFVEQVKGAHPGRRIAVVSHGGALRALLGSLLKIPPGQSQQAISLDNASLTIVALEESGMPVRLVLLNDTAHLESWASL